MSNESSDQLGFLCRLTRELSIRNFESVAVKTVNKQTKVRRRLLDIDEPTLVPVVAVTFVPVKTAAQVMTDTVKFRY